MMKLTILALLMIGLASAAGAADQPTKKKAAPAPAKIREITVPAGAVEIEPYTYRYTDPNGKSWLYRKTPFGVMRAEEKPVSAEDAKKAQDEKDRLIESTSAVEDGDSVRFARQTPFGRSEWRRTKTQLNEVEQAAWNRELQKRAVVESATKD
jgi:hypothetical protein